jgi:hypothetical protein
MDFFQFRICYVAISSGAIQTHQDSREQIIEIMRYAAGQCSNRLHLLRLPEHVLDQLPLLDFLSKSR